MNQPNESMLGSRWSPQIVETTRHHHFLLRSNKHNECSHSDAEEHASILARRMRGNSCSSKTWVKLRSHAISSEGNFTGYIMIHHDISPKNREIHRKAMVSMTIKYIIGSFCNQSSDLMQKKNGPQKIPGMTIICPIDIAINSDVNHFWANPNVAWKCVKHF